MVLRHARTAYRPVALLALLLAVATSAACGRTLSGPEELTLTCVNSDIGIQPRIDRPGTTASGNNNFAGSCGGADGQEQVYLWTSPTTGVYDMFVTGEPGVDTVLYVRDSACNGPEVACGNDESGLDPYVRVHVDAGVEVVIVVDSDGPPGAYELHIVPDL